MDTEACGGDFSNLVDFCVDSALLDLTLLTQVVSLEEETLREVDSSVGDTAGGDLGLVAFPQEHEHGGDGNGGGFAVNKIISL